MKNKERMCFGIIIGTRAYFNSELAKDVRKQLLRTLADEGYDYVILPEDATPTGSSSIETREDGLKCAELFRQNRDRIDGIIVSLPNFGFEIGIINAISVADLNVPILVQACDDENDKVDLDSRRDAFCGKISVCNNLYQYGIPFTDTTLHTYSIYSELLAKDINKFAGICRVVNGLRHARIGAIGARPAGFQTVRASEKLLQKSGITVVPVDRLAAHRLHRVAGRVDNLAQPCLVDRFLRHHDGLFPAVGGGDLLDGEGLADGVIYMGFTHAAHHPVHHKSILCHKTAPFPLRCAGIFC